MSTNYEAFLPEVLPFFPTLPEIVVVNAIRNAAIEFCDRTDWLFYTPVQQDIIAGEDEYDLTLDVPDGHTVARVQSAWVNQYQVLPRSEDELRRLYNLDWRKQTGRPNYYTQYTPETMVLVPIPSAYVSQGLAVTLVIRPVRDGSVCDDSLYQRWLEVIAFGARMRLHEMPGHAYENPQMAEKYRQLFAQGIDKAIIERTRGLSRTTMRVRPPRLL